MAQGPIRIPPAQEGKQPTRLPRWDDPPGMAALRQQLEQAQAIVASSVPPIIKTEADRYIMAMMVRLLETLVHGEPKTPMPMRHNP